MISKLVRLVIPSLIMAIGVYLCFCLFEELNESMSMNMLTEKTNTSVVGQEDVRNFERTDLELENTQAKVTIDLIMYRQR